VAELADYAVRFSLHVKLSASHCVCNSGPKYCAKHCQRVSKDL